MQNFLNDKRGQLAALLTCGALFACGGGGGAGSDTSSSAGTSANSSSSSSSSSSGSSGAGGSTPLVAYNFNAGDSLAAKNGWSFASTSWALAPAADGTGLAMPFTYPGVAPGNYGMSEMRFSMPPADQFWIHLRWHIPANYAHRHDTHLSITGVQAAGWQIGDTVRGTDGISEGVISLVETNGIFLRFAAKSSYNEVWNGLVSNLTRSSSLSASGRSQWAANNKLLAIWADAYSAAGYGPTIIWGTDLDWPGTSRNSTLTVGYSTGGKTVSGAPASAGTLITPADYGKYMDIIFHGKFATSPGAKNGVIRTFVRKQGASTYSLAHNITHADMDKRSDVASNLQQWQSGYLMGWSNSGFDAQTTFAISQIEYFSSLPAVLAGVSP